ncbi:unnamed protein product [Arctia plantaginis]|uniref:GPI inositol-deacylase n=1 Tax=Arctia plantaginis TaxID=874455 RepID=A0A8S0Z1T7_ARCPL|nr:unnamed protein product [Arctia plantaginis]CAB3230004.1 unnamed protein product [Arctia plantaginis]
MTYMYEKPQFVRLSLPENKFYPQYGLYVYGEGIFAEKLRRMWFDGVPVLFLPGTSGSHMQARSFASFALRKSLSKGNHFHFDFFTISYNEELSGLYGGVLQSQTKFAAVSIQKILSLYKQNKYRKDVPTSVILIGHSMGGLIVKRLLAYPSTVNTTSIAITLAAPLVAPVVNVDAEMNDFYGLMNYEWNKYVNNNIETKKNKIMISLGNGPRDLLMPSGLTSSNDSYINALTTAVPGVWVSPDHVSIVWCKQLVRIINKFLFSIIDPVTEQVVQDNEILISRARQYFQANRSMKLNPDVVRSDMTMIADAFWYEDNRRIYQVSRRQIDKTTYVMIRLVKYPQNRFVAVEGVNIENEEWIFGCNAQFTYNTHRYCKQATSLSELSRWTGAANSSAKRKLATVNLHSIKEHYPDWSHVIVKVSPTKKPVILNVDINDHASREMYVRVPSWMSFGKTIIKEETESESLYYELILRDFNTLHQAYLLYVEPTASCKATQYHVSAEMFVPWAPNYEYYHYFTQLKQKPMKLRLFKSNPNIVYGMETTEHVKVTLLLDPQCTYTISIAPSWYHRLGQLVRNYSSVLFPYAAGVVLLAVRSNICELQKRGNCLSMYGALCSERVKPYYVLVSVKLAAVALTSFPIITFLFENSSWKNIEMQYFINSLLILPAYLTAVGIVTITAAAIMLVMIFSSQIAHRLLFRIMWRGSSNLTEKIASGLQKVPIVVTVSMLCAAPLSCGAAALVVGAAFYSFMLSKMYEDYLEDYVYKLMAKIASKVCRMFKKKQSSEEAKNSLIERDSIETSSQSINEDQKCNSDREKIKPIEVSQNKDVVAGTAADTKENTKDTQYLENRDITVGSNSDGIANEKKSEQSSKRKESNNSENNLDMHEGLNNLNFHMMLFFMWLTVTLVNMPALLTWARNFRYSKVLETDTSYHTGLVMSACSGYVWQINGPRKHLRSYETVSALLFTMAVIILVLGPLYLPIVNYGVTFMFVTLTVQQMFDKEKVIHSKGIAGQRRDKDNEEFSEEKQNSKESSEQTETSTSGDKCNVCSESRIYNLFQNLREKFSFIENL